MRVLLLLVLAGCGFQYQINPYFDNQAVRSIEVCKDVDEDNVTRNLNCALWDDYEPPTDYTRGGPYYTVGGE